jgi:hypothetical protein
MPYQVYPFTALRPWLSSGRQPRGGRTTGSMRAARLAKESDHTPLLPPQCHVDRQQTLDELTALHRTRSVRHFSPKHVEQAVGREPGPERAEMLVDGQLRTSRRTQHVDRAVGVGADVRDLVVFAPPRARARGEIAPRKRDEARPLGPTARGRAEALVGLARRREPKREPPEQPMSRVTLPAPTIAPPYPPAPTGRRPRRHPRRSRHTQR